MSTSRVPLFTRGVALETIMQGEVGVAYFEDLGEVKVRAVENIVQYSEIIAVDGQNGVKEYERKSQYLFDKEDYAQVTYGATEVTYEIGTNAYNTDGTAPWGKRFSAKRLLLLPSTNCRVRFNKSTRVQHLLFANQQYEFWVKTTLIYVTAQAVGGTLEVHAEG